MTRLLIGMFAGLLLMTALVVFLIPGEEHSDKTTLTWVTDPNPQRVPQVKAFNALHPDLHLRIDPDNSGVMKVIVQCSAGMGPDLIGHVSRWSFTTYRDAGILLDVTEEARRMGFGPDTMDPATARTTMLQDLDTLEWRQYTYPANFGNTIIIYNKDIFDRQGVPFPPRDLTWTEYIDLAGRLTRYENQSDAVPSLFGGGGANLEQILWSCGGDLINEEGTRSLLGEPEAVEACLFYHALLYEHAVEPTPSQKAGVSSQGGWGAGSYYSWFGEGRIAMFFGSRWMLIQMRRHFAELTKAGQTPPRMGACFVPAFEGKPRFTPAGGRGVGINKNSPNREAALKFLQYLASERYCGLINQGADAMPGNKAYISEADFLHPDWPGEQEINRISIEAMGHARGTRTSLFVDAGGIDRALTQVKDHLVANESVTREEVGKLLRRAARKVDEEIARNVSRNPRLQKAYHSLVARGADSCPAMVEVN